jgi:hypothetical protein
MTGVFETLAKSAETVALGRSDVGLTQSPASPVCFARAASGHAAAPPSSVMNSRRPMQNVI